MYYPYLRSLLLAMLTCCAIGACGGGSGGSDPVPPRVLTAISVSPSELTLEALDATSQLRAAARDQDGNAMSAQFNWSSSDTTVVTVDADGLVTASANGTTTVTVRSGAVSATVTVTVEQQPASIAVSPGEVVLSALGATQQMEVSILDANDNAMTAEPAWTSSDPAVAEIGEDGRIIARANGTATVTANAGSVSDTATVTVRQVLDRLILLPDNLTLTVSGESTQLQAMALDANGHPMAINVSLSSSDPAVASVSAEGVVTAGDNGTTTITATVFDQGRSLSVSVTIIVDVPPPPLIVTGDPHARDPRSGRTPLHVAAMANAPRLIAALVAAGADVEARDEDTLTPLHFAAGADAAAAIAVLLEAGADLEARNRLGETPLLFAARGVAPAAIAALLEAGADPDARESDTGRTALHRAAWAADDPRELAMLEALLEAGADPNARNDDGNTPLRDAVVSDSLVATVVLLEAGANPNARNDPGWTPLWYWVALAEDPAVFAALLEAGADIGTRDGDGRPLLHLAAARDRPAAIVALLEAGVDLHARDDTGGTALHAAARSEEFGLPLVAATGAIAALLEAGSDTDARDDLGRTPLGRAPGSGRETVSALLDAHAGRTVLFRDSRDTYGYTALHAAARADSPRLIAALLDAGADIEALDNEGNTPLLLAAGRTRRTGRNIPPPSFSPAAVAALAAAGADLEARGRSGGSALHRAAVRGETATIEALLAAGADVDAPVGDGVTALDLALDRGHAKAALALARAEAELEASDYRDFARVLVLALENPAALADSGLDLDAGDSRGLTVLHWIMGLDESVAWPALTALLDAGADVDARDNGGRNAVYWAVVRRNPAMIAALAEAGANLNVRRTGHTALHQAVLRRYPEMVAALVRAGADLELRDFSGWTPLHLAAYEGEPAMIAAMVKAGADLEARDNRGRSALQLAADRDYPAQDIGQPSTPAAVAALIEAGADLDVLDNDGNSPLIAAAEAGNLSATGVLLALGANWPASSDEDLAEMNARIVAVELFQGPMVWEWQPDEPEAGEAGPGTREGSIADHANALLHRPAAVALRIGSEVPGPLPELSVSLNFSDGRAWTGEADLVQGPRIASAAGHSASGLWETEYVYELPADWARSGHQAVFAIDPFNRLAETDETDNVATLTMDGYTAPAFAVTFVPVVLSGDPPAIDTDTYMAVIADLVPIGEHRAQVGRKLDLSYLNLGIAEKQESKETALRELLHRWNAEAFRNEYYYGVLSSAEFSVSGFGGAALLGGPVSVSDAISESCQVEREFCGHGVHAHEVGHNLGLEHAPANCSEPEPIDPDFPYPGGGIGPRRGWVATRNEFVNPGDENRHYDVMGYCRPRFVSDYNYNKMMDERVGPIPPGSGGSGRIGPRFEINPAASGTSSFSALQAPAIAYSPPPRTASPSDVPGAASTSDASGPGTAITDAIEEIGPSLAFTGSVDEYGLWSIFRIDSSTRPPRPPSGGGEYYFTLQDAFQQEIYREPMTLLAPAHGETGLSWAVRVPVPDRPPAWVTILNSQGTPLFIEPVDEPPTM